MKKKNLRFYLLLAILISISSQLAFILFLGTIRTPGYFLVDGDSYLSIAGNLYFRGVYAYGGYCSEKRWTESPTRMRQPAYPLYLYFFYWMLGQSTLVFQLSQVALNLVTICMIYHISREVFGDRMWGWTIILVALYLPSWIMSAFTMAEVLFTFFLTLVMLLLIKAIRSRKRSIYFFTGLAFGTAFLTRTVCFPILLLSIIPIHFNERKLRRAIQNWGVMVLAFLLCISPWFIRNAVVFGDYTIFSTEGGHNIWSSTLEDYPARKPGSECPAIDRYGPISREGSKLIMDMAIKNIKADPWSYLRLGLDGIGRVWSHIPGTRAYSGWPVLFGFSVCIQLLILFFAAAGLLALDRWRAAYMLLPAISVTAAMLFSMRLPRYILPVMPFVVVLAGQGLSEIKQLIFKARNIKSNL